MDTFGLAGSVCALAPVTLMAILAGLTQLRRVTLPGLWVLFQALSFAILAGTGICLWLGREGAHWPGVATAGTLSLVVALLVQSLGAVIGAFSARYLQGEPGQRRYVAALAMVLAGVHLLLMADHWLLLIAAWAFVGIALQDLLCFYPDRPFARLAAHKKQIADRVADGLLLGAAALAWLEVGSGSLSALWNHIALHGLSASLQMSAVLLALAVILRTALLPVHGWLIQVMEAPTPVSALLHAGVVNLGGFVLIRFAPLLAQSVPARCLLLAFGLATAAMAGMVTLTRVSIKVRLAWSTVAQMGFMLLECAVGLYTLAALHLLGHSLYKAHAFLSASGAVRQTRLQALRGASSPLAVSLWLAPVLTICSVFSVSLLAGHTTWPWWWCVVLGVAWAPLLWLPATPMDWQAFSLKVLSGVLMAVGLTMAALTAHALPLGLRDAPQEGPGRIAMIGMAALYAFQILLQTRPQSLAQWRRWTYAGFYLDEAYTRLALTLWPTQWTPASSAQAPPQAVTPPLAGASTELANRSAA